MSQTNHNTGRFASTCAVVALAAVFAGSCLVLAQGKDKTDPDKDPKKKIEVPIDPTPRVIYQYGPNRRFGISATQTAGMPEGKRLTYSADGQTNMGVIKIDGDVKELGSAAGRWTKAEPAPFPKVLKAGTAVKKRASQGTWVTREQISVTQLLDVVPGQQPVQLAGGKQVRYLDTCLILYVLKNDDRKTHKVGLRLEIDTLIGGNDGVPFTVPGLPGLVSTQYDFPDAEKVPDFIQALERPDLKSPGTVAHMSLKIGRNVEPPGRVSLTHWTGGNGAWDIPLQNMGTDSTVILYWPEADLKPGEKRIVGFSYGLGSIASQEGKLGLSVSGTFEKDSTFTAVATVTDAKRGTTLKLVLPAELERVKGEETQAVPEAAGKGSSLVTWQIKAKQAGQFTIQVQASGGGNAAREITITDRPLLLNPILGEPGKK